MGGVTWEGVAAGWGKKGRGHGSSYLRGLSI